MRRSYIIENSFRLLTQSSFMIGVFRSLDKLKSERLGQKKLPESLFFKTLSACLMFTKGDNGKWILLDWVMLVVGLWRKKFTSRILLVS